MSRWPEGPAPAEPARYELRVRGVQALKPGRPARVQQVSCDQAGQTTITGLVADQAALNGLLTKIRDLGLELLSVRRIDPDR